MICSYRLTIVISLFLTLATAAAFWQLPGHDFITIDDKNLGNSCYEGETANPMTFTLTNSGGATLPYTIEPSYNIEPVVPWLSLSPSTSPTTLTASASQPYSVTHT